MRELAWFTLLVVFPFGCSGKTDGESKELGISEGKSKRSAKSPLTKTQAIGEIEKLGGKVTGVTGYPVFAVRLTGIKFTDEEIVCLKRLTGLRMLAIQNTRITDAGLVHLKGLTKLTFLTLDHTKVTDAGLVHLKRLTMLHGLDLTNTKVTAAGVKKLQAALPKCKIRR